MDWALDSAGAGGYAGFSVGDGADPLLFATAPAPAATLALDPALPPPPPLPLALSLPFPAPPSPESDARMRLACRLLLEAAPSPSDGPSDAACCRALEELFWPGSGRGGRGAAAQDPSPPVAAPIIFAHCPALVDALLGALGSRSGVSELFEAACRALGGLFRGLRRAAAEAAAASGAAAAPQQQQQLDASSPALVALLHVAELLRRADTHPGLLPLAEEALLPLALAPVRALKRREQDGEENDDDEAASSAAALLRPHWRSLLAALERAAQAVGGVNDDDDASTAAADSLLLLAARLAGEAPEEWDEDDGVVSASAAAAAVAWRALLLPPPDDDEATADPLLSRPNPEASALITAAQNVNEGLAAAEGVVAGLEGVLAALSPPPPPPPVAAGRRRPSAASATPRRPEERAAAVAAWAAAVERCLPALGLLAEDAALEALAVPAAVKGLLAMLLLLPTPELTPPALPPPHPPARRLLAALLGHPRRRVRARTLMALRDCASDPQLPPMSRQLAKPDAEALWAVVARFGFGGGSGGGASSSSVAAAAAAALLALLPRTPLAVAFKWYTWIECHASAEPSCAALLCAMKQQRSSTPLLALLPSLFSLEAPVRRAGAHRLPLLLLLNDDDDDNNDNDPFVDLLVNPSALPDAATAARRRAQDGGDEAVAARTGGRSAALLPPLLARSVALLGGDPALCPPAAVAAFTQEEISELARVMLNRTLPPGVRAEAGEQLAPLAAAAPPLRAAALGSGGGIGAFVRVLEEEGDIEHSLCLKIAAADLLFVFAARGAFFEEEEEAVSAAATAALALARHRHPAARPSAARLLACLAFSAASGAWAGFYPRALLGSEGGDEEEEEEEEEGDGTRPPCCRLPPIFAEGDVVARLPLPLASSHAFPFAAEAVEVVASAEMEVKKEEREAALSELVQRRRLLRAAAAAAMAGDAQPLALARAIEASSSTLRAESGASAEVAKLAVAALRSCPDAARERLALQAVRAAGTAGSHAAFAAATGALRSASASREGLAVVRALGVGAVDEQEEEEEEEEEECYSFSAAPAWARALTKRVLGPSAPETAEDREAWLRALRLAGRLLGGGGDGDGPSSAAAAASLLLRRLAPAAAEWLSRPFEEGDDYDAETTRELLALLRRALAAVVASTAASPSPLPLLPLLLRSLADAFLPSPSVAPLTRAMALDVVAEASSIVDAEPLCACIRPAVEAGLVPALAREGEYGIADATGTPVVASALRALLAITSAVQSTETWAAAWTALDPPGSLTATSTFWLRRLFCGDDRSSFRAAAAALAARLASASPRARLLLLRGWPDVHACMMEVVCAPGKDDDEDWEARAGAMEFLVAAAAVQAGDDDGGEAEDDSGSNAAPASSCFGLASLLSATDMWARHLPRALERAAAAAAGVSGEGGAAKAAAAAASLALAAAAADPQGPACKALLDSCGGCGRRALVRLASSAGCFNRTNGRGAASAAAAASAAVQALAAVALDNEELAATQDAASAAVLALVDAAATLERQAKEEDLRQLRQLLLCLARRACDALNALLLLQPLAPGAAMPAALLAAAATAASGSGCERLKKTKRKEDDQAEQQALGAGALLAAVASVLERGAGGGGAAATTSAAALAATLLSGSGSLPACSTPRHHQRLCRALLGALPADVFEAQSSPPHRQQQGDDDNANDNAPDSPPTHILLAALRNLLWSSASAREAAAEAGLGLALSEAVSSAAGVLVAAVAASKGAATATKRPAASPSLSTPAAIAWEAAAAARRARLSALAEAKRSGRPCTASTATVVGGEGGDKDDDAARERDARPSSVKDPATGAACCHEPIYGRMRLCLDVLACMCRADGGGGDAAAAVASSPSASAPPPPPVAAAAAAALVQAWDALSSCCRPNIPSSHERALLSLLGVATELAAQQQHAFSLAPLADRAAAALLPAPQAPCSLAGGPAAAVASARWALTLNVSNRTRVVVPPPKPAAAAGTSTNINSNNSSSNSPAVIAASAAFLRRFATAGGSKGIEEAENQQGSDDVDDDGRGHAYPGATHLCRAGPRGFLGRALAMLHERGAAAATAAAAAAAAATAGGASSAAHNNNPSSTATERARLAAVCGVLAALAATGPGRRGMLVGGGGGGGGAASGLASSSPLSVLGSATQLLHEAGRPGASPSTSSTTTCALLALVRHLCLSPAALARPHVLAAGLPLVRAVAGLLLIPPAHQQAMAALALRAVLHGGGERAKALLRAVEGAMEEAGVVPRVEAADGDGEGAEAAARAALEEVLAAVATAT